MPSYVGGEDGRRRPMRSAESSLAIRHAVALGLLQGPAELLPISSSGHTALAPWLAGWSYAELDGELRKAVEVSLHAGAGIALAIEMRGELRAQARSMSRRRALMLALSLAPPALAGFALRRPIERWLGGPRSIAAGLALGGVGMVFSDIRRGRAGRAATEAGPLDGLALGIAQASALIPGVSRNGATLTAARARGFDREAAQVLSWEVALPVILAATTLKGGRLLRGHRVAPQARAALAVGGVSAFASTLASARILRRGKRTQAPPLLPFALYRCLLAGVVMVRLRRRGR
jgi:undecaprenyl-diphosphatase